MWKLGKKLLIGCFRFIFLLGLVINTSAQTPTFSLAGSLSQARVAHSATLLNDGRVLIVGGGQGPDWLDGFWVVSEAELFDPETRTFTSAGTLSRDLHSATLLKSGQVLLVGGETGWAGYSPIVSQTADIYDPLLGQFRPTGSMAVAREYHSATLLRDGRVLIAGGARLSGLDWENLASAEIYDPVTQTFTATESMRYARSAHSVILLADGRVLVAGGQQAAELYDPVTGSFTEADNMVYPRPFTVATQLLDGRVLITGGAVAEVYDPVTSTFLSTGNVQVNQLWHSATLLRDGTVLITGGSGMSPISEIYDPKSNAFTRSVDATFPRVMHTATMLQDGTVVVIGGAQMRDGIHLDFVNPSEIYKGNPSGSITASPNPCNSSAGLCTTHISWSTIEVSNAQVWVKVNYNRETLFAIGTACGDSECPAPWILGNGLTYTFSLYNCDAANCTPIEHQGAQLLSAIKVTGHD